MSSTVLKPNPISSVKMNDPVGAILNRARSTLSQSRQFRDPAAAPSSSISTSKARPNSNLVDSYSSTTNLKTSSSKQIQSAGKRDLDNNKQSKQTTTTTNSIDGFPSRSSKFSIDNFKTQNRSIKRGIEIPPSPNPTKTKVNTVVGPQTTKSGANYDYDSIFSNVNVSKKAERSSFNIFNIGNVATNASMSTKDKATEFEGPIPQEKVKQRSFQSRSIKLDSKSNNNNTNNKFKDGQKGKNFNKNDDDDDDDDEEDSESESSSSATSSNETTTDDEDTENDTKNGSSTITPPTITETTSKSLSSSNKPKVKQVVQKIRPMSLKAITLNDDKPPTTTRRIKIQDLRDRPLVFLSNESHAVFKAMSPDNKDKDFDSFVKKFDNTPPKSYTEDFVSEIQSVADDFSKSFARSLVAEEKDDDEYDEDEDEDKTIDNSSILEVPRTESESVEIPASSTSGGESEQNRSLSKKKMSLENAFNSLRIFKEIKGNLQDLEISDATQKLSEEEEAALAKAKQVEEHLKNNIEDPSLASSNAYSKDLIISAAGSTTSNSNRTSSNKRIQSSSSKSAQVKKSHVINTSTNKVSSISNNSRAKTSNNPVSFAKTVSNHSKLPINPMISNNNLPPPRKQSSIQKKPPSQIELTLSRQSSRKNFQATLSQVKLQDDADDQDIILMIQSNPDVKVKVRKLEQKFAYNAPKTKPQTNIHSILEKEVYRKELSRLRKAQEREEKDIQKINETRSRNFRKVQEIQGKVKDTTSKSATRFRQPTLNFPTEQDQSEYPSSANLGAPYFNKNGSLGIGYRMENLPQTPNNEHYAAKVGQMAVPQLVREVLKSNERMYKMTVRAAKEMSKEYGKNVKLARKIKESHAAATRQ